MDYSKNKKMEPGDQALIELAQQINNGVLPNNIMEASRIIQKELGVGAVRDPAKYGAVDPDAHPAEHYIG